MRLIFQHQPRCLTAAAFRSLFRGSNSALVFFVLLFVVVATLTRVALLIKASPVVAFDASLAAAFAWGVVYDFGAALLVVAPLALALTLIPTRILTLRPTLWFAHVLVFAALFVSLFGAVAEWVFWDEFGSRFNFIAVDYLVYTKEVLGNIRESYPMALIIGALFAATSVVYLGIARTRLIDVWSKSAPEQFRVRVMAGGTWIAASVCVAVVFDSDQLPSFNNNYNRELAKDGVWSLFGAFRNNELNYDQFYLRLTDENAFRRLDTALAGDGSVPLPRRGHDTLRFVHNPGPELRMNVIQITVESLSADFLGIFNRASRLTPNLEMIARKSLVFDRLYATGTRTDRGMEALTLSLPPTPGRSLIKRPHNENLFTLGSVFRSRGYETAFLYGGFGYFDNMNYFFGNNGYRVIDRTSVSSSDITFANVWGACDEDLYRWTMREADDAHAREKPFHYFVMTTSNHRPFTFPDGRIDLPSKTSGRAGAVKYSDYAIGKFLRDAESKPWFKNTIFVIVADHCASVAGKTALPVENYHIPMLIYTPGGQIAPGHVKDLMSQVDYAPTLLGLLNWSYATRFFGWDVRQATGERRILIGNYQKLGLYEPGRLSVLMPNQQEALYHHDSASTALKQRPTLGHVTEGTIAYYQTASYLYRNRLYREVTHAEQERFSRIAAEVPPRVQPLAKVQ
jgi:phosphoglycerol transferase MdoB-like AlkP superfamily enzyme